MVKWWHIVLVFVWCLVLTACGTSETGQSIPVGTWEGTFKLVSGNSGKMVLSVQPDGKVYGSIKNPDRQNAGSVELIGSVSKNMEFNANYRIYYLNTNVYPIPKGTINGNVAIDSDRLSITISDTFDGISLNYSCDLIKTSVMPPSVSPLGKYVLKEFMYKNTKGVVYSNSTDLSIYGDAIITNTRADSNYGFIMSDGFTMIAAPLFSQTYSIIGSGFGDDLIECNVNVLSTYTDNTIEVVSQYYNCNTQPVPEEKEVWIKISDSIN